MSNKKRIMGIVVGLAVVLVAGVLIGTNVQKQSKKVSYLSASWEYNYRDVQELAQSSELIALAKITGVKETKQKLGDVPYTIYSAKVKQAIYGTEDGNTFDIYMTGGETKNEIMEIKDDPLPEKGDEVLVFCKKNEDGTYRILGGPQGRLVYEDGKLNSLSAVNENVRSANTASNIMIKDADAKDLIAEIQEYVKADAK